MSKAIYTIKNNMLLAWVAVLTMFVIVSMGIEIAQARFTEVTFDQVVEDRQAIDNHIVNLHLIGVGAATSSVLVDLDDVTNFPHERNAGAIEVSKILLDWGVAQGNEATSTIKVGVVASTTDTGDLSDVYWFAYANFNSFDGGNHQTKELDFSPSVAKLGLSSGAPTDILSGDISTSTANYATTTAIQSPYVTTTRFTTAPEAGDLVLDVATQEGTADIRAQAFYHIK